MQPSAGPPDVSTPRNNPSGLDTLSSFLIALREQDKLLTEAMNASRREISVPHVGFIKGIFDKISAFDPNLVSPFATSSDPATSLAQIRDAIAKLKARVELLEREDVTRLRNKRANLSSLLSQFEQQGEVLKGLIPRSASWQGAPDSLMNVLRDLFAQAASALPEKGIRFENNNDLDGLGGQIISVKAKIAAGLSVLDGALNEHSSSVIAKAPSVPPPAIKQVRLDDEPWAGTLSDPNSSASAKAQPVVFIGHGRAKDWLELKEFLTERLGINCVEFNSESAAGLSPQQRLEDMLAQASFAFLLLTAEDEHADGSRHARENVIHEAGLFQGKLGFRKAILLVEDDCERPSNVHGLTHIGFPKSRITASFEEIRKVLERERVI